MTKQEYEYLGRGDAGCYATCVPKQYGSSTSRASVSGMYSDLSRYYYKLIEGGVVVDKRPCFEKDATSAIRLVISGPMRNETLAPGHYQKLYEEPKLYEPGVKLGGFDYIAMDLYLESWRKLGARVGKRVGDVIQWEDGTTEAIIETGE